MTRQTPKRLLACSVLFVAVAGLTGCEDEEPKASSLGEAEVALAASSVYGADDDDLHGRIILVNGDGSVRTVETEGLYFASATSDGQRVYTADAHHQIVIDHRSVRSLDLRGEYDMEDWAGQAGAHHWTLFNVGTRGSNTYYTGVVATDGESVAEGQVEGEVMGQAACGDRLTLAVADWRKPRDPHGTNLRDLTVTGEKIVETEERTVVLPPGGHVTNLACVRDRPVLLAQQRERDLVSMGDKLGAAGSWTEVPPPRRGAPRVDGDDVLLGAVESELFFYFPREGVRALDVDTMRSRQVIPADEAHANTQVALDGDTLLAWVSGGSDDSVFRWYDARTGKVERELSAGAVDDMLDQHGESVDRAPESLSLR